MQSSTGWAPPARRPSTGSSTVETGCIPNNDPGSAGRRQAPTVSETEVKCLMIDEPAQSPHNAPPDERSRPTYREWYSCDGWILNDDPRLEPDGHPLQSSGQLAG